MSTKEEEALESKALNRAIERAQKGIEGKTSNKERMFLNMMILLMSREKLSTMREIKF